jgi:HEAT repeat protein
VVPNAGDSSLKGMPSGVKARRVGNSLEVEVQAKRGSNITVQPRFNRLDLVVEGGTEERASAADEQRAPVDRRRGALEDNQYEAAQPSARAQREPRGTRSNVPLDRLSETDSQPLSSGDKYITPSSSSVSVTLPSGPPVPGASNASTVPPNAAAHPATAEVDLAAEKAVVDRDVSSYVFYSGWWITLFLAAALAGLVVWRRKDKSEWTEVTREEVKPVLATPVNQAIVNTIVGERRRGRERRTEGRGGGRRSNDRPAKVSSEIIEPNEQLLEQRSGVATLAPAVLFGAYRVDQEVGKLVLGQAHRIDVLASRAGDDRRAMEASLLKALRGSLTDEAGRRKVRQALEEYGFVARQSAALLLARDACDRTSAAKLLGEVGSSTSLQFLLEALYDSEAIVRTQAVESIGALKLPSAIGALLDMARRYPDMPSSIVSSALNACSIDNLDFFDAIPVQPALLGYGGNEPFSAEITQLDPSATVYDLPESTDDEALVDTLAHLQSGDAEARAAAAQSLAIYRVQRSVAALKSMAADDEEPAVRAAAVASLGAIDHESVFSAVLVALADEARDVRAAAARALSRLSFDRADAYVRVIETSDSNELTNVARACIKTGMAAQALDRLASDDRRQAYEAFSLLSLLVRANESQPVMDAIENHLEVNVRLIAVQLLGMSARPEVVPQLRHLAVREAIPEEVRTALLEVVYKIDQLETAEV